MSLPPHPLLRSSNEPVRYIRNKDLLAEIHRSKNSYCSFLAPEYSRYDLIVGDVSEILRSVDAAKAKRASALSTKESKVLPASVEQDDLVFRVMTGEHIPDDPNRKRRGKGPNEMQARTNFPPFKHYVIKDGEPFEVGRSHWKGGLQNGEFCIDHGRIGNRLAQMFMLLVERYSSRSNWRGYCVDEQTQALTQRGWIGGDDLTTDDVILSYKDGDLTWSSIKSIYRNHYEGDMFRLTVSGLDALVTPGHKFVTDTGLRTVEMLREKDKVILTGAAEEGPSTPVYDDAFVELVGWVATEGNFHRSKERRYPRVSLWQNEGEYAQRIRNCLNALGARFAERVEKGGPTIRFQLTKELSNRLADVLVIDSGKALSASFILSLTQSQRMLLINTMVDGDGHRTNGLLRYSQKNADHVDSFVMLCTLAGLRTSTKIRNMVSYGKETATHMIVVFSDSVQHSNVENIDFHGGKRNGETKGRGKELHPNEPTVPYNGKVWCPETEYGSFMARRNGYVYLTGNSYVDEMRNHALLQLTMIGLQFDESKSDNPFAFYTTVVRNCFTRVLNLEKRGQHIRDDLLMMAGAAPSFSRQIDHEMEQAKVTETPASAPTGEADSGEVAIVPVKTPAKRGRKPKKSADDGLKYLMKTQHKA